MAPSSILLLNLANGSMWSTLGVFMDLAASPAGLHIYESKGSDVLSIDLLEVSSVPGT